jgi:hypothetical protein
MILPSIKRIFKQDFESQFQNLVEQLSFIINSNTEVLFQALNNGLTFEDNIFSETKTLAVTVDSTGAPTKSLSFQNTLGSSITGLQVINAVSTAKGASIYPTGGIFCSFSQNGQTVTINNITGLPANVAFSISIVTYGEN